MKNVKEMNVLERVIFNGNIVEVEVMDKKIEISNRIANVLYAEKQLSDNYKTDDKGYLIIPKNHTKNLIKMVGADELIKASNQMNRRGMKQRLAWYEKMALRCLVQLGILA